MSSTPYETVIPTSILTSADTVRTVKFAFLESAPGIKQGHLDEALAAGFGFKKRASLLEALKGGAVVVPISDDAFRARLGQLGHEVPKGQFEEIAERKLAANLSSGIQRRRPDGGFEFLDDGRPEWIPDNDRPETQPTTRKPFNIREAMEAPMPSAEALLGEKGLQAVLKAMENPVPLPPRDPDAPNAFLESIVKPIVVARSTRRLPFVQPNSARRT